MDTIPEENSEHISQCFPCSCILENLYIIFGEYRIISGQFSRIFGRVKAPLVYSLAFSTMNYETTWRRIFEPPFGPIAWCVANQQNCSPSKRYVKCRNFLAEVVEIRIGKPTDSSKSLSDQMTGDFTVSKHFTSI